MTVRQGLVAAVMAWSIYAGFISARFLPLSWPMFAYNCAVRIVLRSAGCPGDDSNRRLSLYYNLPSHAPTVTMSEFRVFLDWLNDQQLLVEGDGVFLGNRGEYPISVRNGHVVD